MKLSNYDNIIFSFSGGKDSLACVLHLLEQHPELRGRMEMWHHDVDGREGERFMDWPVTPAYCRAVAGALELPLFFQWKIGGFEREMLRQDERTQGVRYEDRTDGHINELPPSDRGKLATRRKFPQVSADLSVRWCSAYLKIDVAKRVIKKEFRGELDKPVKVLMVTGERAEESSSRSRYAEFESLSETRRRHFHQWRPVHKWSERQVWDIIERWRINPHPAYHLGWGRVSCAACIFGNADQWASVKELLPDVFEKVANYEVEFGTTIHRDKSVRQQALAGRVYDEAIINQVQADLARSEEYPDGLILVPEGEWELPAGAFRKCGGPI